MDKFLKAPKPVICSVLLPNPEPWAWQNGQLDESILSLMDVHRHFFYAELDAR